MKKILSLFVAVILLITCLPFNAFIATAAQNRNDLIRRYTVLLLDVSAEVQFMNEDGEIIYTANPAIDDVKTSAGKFLTALGRAQGENHIAVVAYDSQPTLVTGFTTDISSAQREVERLTVQDDFTNISAALDKANALLDDITVEDAVKNVVLVTTGMTNYGNYSYNGRYDDDTVGSEWQRMDTEVALYAYANKAVNSAAYLKEQATVYVLGLFQTMADVPSEGKSAAEFFRVTARDIASTSQFYEVTNPNNLDFTFASIVGRILSSNGKFKYRGFINNSSNSETEYYYSDSYFLNDARIYNASLATMSLCMELASWPAYTIYDSGTQTERAEHSQNDDGWYWDNETENSSSFWRDNDHLRNIKELFYGNGEDNPGIGFSGFQANDSWKAAPTKNSIGVCAAKKQIQGDDGNVYTLIALPIRGGGYGSEWASNLKVGSNGEHEGFAEARDKVLDFLYEYLEGLSSEESNIKLWITGYSRAGAVSNMVAGKLDSIIYHSNGVLTLPNGRTVTLMQKDLYCYTFEAPQGVPIGDASGSSGSDDPQGPEDPPYIANHDDAAMNTPPRYYAPYNAPNYRNIHNTINLNDVVPLVAPSSWGFARYNYRNDRILPCALNSSEFRTNKEEMLKELEEMNYGPNNSYGFQYKIAEGYRTTNLLGGLLSDAIYQVANGTYPTSPIIKDTNTWLNRGINVIADDLFWNRWYYEENIQDSLCKLLEVLLDYYGVVSGGNIYVGDEAVSYFIEKLKELFSSENLLYIFEPLLESIIFGTDEEAAIDECKERLDDKIDELFIDINGASADRINHDINTIRDSLKTILDNFVELRSSLQAEEKMTDLFMLLCILGDTKLQAHYPEITLAWVRSQDPNYNPNIQNTNSTVTRPIRINCPVDVEVYDSENNLCAAIRNNEADETIADSLMAYVNENGEKILYLPGDETYDVRITATDNGEVNYSVSELDFRMFETTRLENYYKIPVTAGDTLHATVSAINEEELEQSSETGSTAAYTLDKNGTALRADEVFVGSDTVADQTYNVTVKQEGNGGYAFGGGEDYLKGSFVQMQASMYPNGEFLGWYDGETLISDDPQYRFAVTEDITLTAKFNELQFNRFKFSIDGQGSVNRNAGYYPADAEIEIKAEPDEGYEFVCWTSSDGGTFENAKNNETKFRMPDKDITIIAHFREIGAKPDLNKDSKINIADAVLLLRYVSEDTIDNTEIPDNNKMLAADLDCDGILTLADVVLLLASLTGNEA